MADAKVKEFVSGHSDWIEEKLNKVETRKREKQSRDGRVVLYRGKNLELDYVSGVSFAIKIDGDKLLVNSETAGDEKEYIRRLYRRNAKAYLTKRTLEIADRYGFAPQTVRLSSARRSWGSCNARKRSINLNWRLIMAPPDTTDYIIIHELCHLRHPNHSSAFWGEIGQFVPDWKRHRQWLKENGSFLDV